MQCKSEGTWANTHTHGRAHKTINHQTTLISLNVVVLSKKYIFPAEIKVYLKILWHLNMP